MSNKNILYIWDADYPWDVRVEKICTSLAANGHEVHIASRNLKKRNPYELIQNLHVHRLQIWKNKSLNYYLSFPLFFSPLWRSFIHRIIRENQIQLIIVRDLPLAILGIWAGKKFKLPVIFDMAEDYVAMLKDIWAARKFSGFNLVVRNPALARYVERYVIKHSDHIFIVVEDAMEIIIRNSGDPDKVTIVSNTPVLESPVHDATTQASCINNTDINLISDRYSAIYTGGIQMGRGIHTVINALPEIVQRIPDFLFVVVGDGYAVNRLKGMAAENGVSEHILWPGWIEHEKLFSYIQACKLGLIPHLVTDHVNTTIPNKIFDYMICGLPVVASDAGPMKRIIDSENTGKTFVSGDPASLVDAIFEIFESSVNFGANAKLSVKEKHNWNIDKRRMLNVVNSIVKPH